MHLQTTPKIEIFLLLALKQKARRDSTAPPIENSENETNDAGKNLTAEDFPALLEQLSAVDATELRERLGGYQNKSETEKDLWRENVEASIGADEQFIDDNVHRSHIENALQKEILPVRKIITDALSNAAAGAAQYLPDQKNQKKYLLEKHVRRAFARQFVTLREIEKATAFDRLSGTQLARMIRLAGVHEVSTACLRIEAVEAVAAFIRNFPAEDARMIAAQLGAERQVSEERIAFAENLVHAAFEIEPNPSMMLDWLGIWLTGILLCQSPPARVRYTGQKLPLEFALGLPAMIEEKCRRTPPAMQQAIGAEIERLAVTVAETA